MENRAVCGTAEEPLSYGVFATVNHHFFACDEQYASDWRGCANLQKEAPPFQEAPCAFQEAEMTYTRLDVYNPYQAENQCLYQPIYSIPTAAITGPCAAPSYTHSDAAAVMFTGSMDMSQHVVAELHPETSLSYPSGFAAPQHGITKSRKRRAQRCPVEEQQAYVKKPLNAYMLFLKEQRPHVNPEIYSRGSAVVNTYLGEKWRSLAENQKDKYYEEAKQQRRLHKAENPEWSAKHNYGKKLCRVRNR